MSIVIIGDTNKKQDSESHYSSVFKGSPASFEDLRHNETFAKQIDKNFSTSFKYKATGSVPQDTYTTMTASDYGTKGKCKYVVTT